MSEIPIKLTYLIDEWEILEKMAQEKGAKNFRHYVKTSLSYLAINCIIDGEIKEPIKKSNNYIIGPNICNKLIHLSQKRHIPLGALVRFYVSDPLLREHLEKQFKQPPAY